MTNETKKLTKRGRAYTVKEVADKINCKPQWVKRHHLKLGKLKGYQWSGERGAWTIYEKDLDEFIKKYMNHRGKK